MGNRCGTLRERGQLPRSQHGNGPRSPSGAPRTRGKPSSFPAGHGRLPSLSVRAASPPRGQATAGAFAVGYGVLRRARLAEDDVTFLCRMLDAQPLRRAVSESGAELAFIISDYVYEKLVLRRRSLADHRSFRLERTQVKRTRWAPGSTCPPGRRCSQARTVTPRPPHRIERPQAVARRA